MAKLFGLEEEWEKTINYGDLIPFIGKCKVYVKRKYLVLFGKKIKLYEEIYPDLEDDV